LTAAIYFYISRIMEELDVITALAALAQDSRLRVFRLLVTAGPDGLAAGQIGQELAIPANTLSFHLSHLKSAGLVTVRRDGRSLIYAAEYDRMRAVMDYLTENCCARSPCCPPEEKPS
jgi:DNA-binding transcriptional ArsR family regulator